ncbi:MAG: hypothetical protein WAM42_02125, partial [Candidatus Nitrosopolaris sp.]
LLPSTLLLPPPLPPLLLKQPPSFFPKCTEIHIITYHHKRVKALLPLSLNNMMRIQITTRR